MLLWVVRGTDDNGNDLTAVIEAATRAEAEYMALRRGLPVVIVSEATSRDVATARAGKMLWKYSQDARYRAFGRTVNAVQLACLERSLVARCLDSPAIARRVYERTCELVGITSGMP